MGQLGPWVKALEHGGWWLPWTFREGPPPSGWGSQFLNVSPTNSISVNPTGCLRVSQVPQPVNAGTGAGRRAQLQGVQLRIVLRRQN